MWGMSSVTYKTYKDDGLYPLIRQVPGQSLCFVVENPKIFQIKTYNRRCSMEPCSEQFLKVS